MSKLLTAGTQAAAQALADKMHLWRTANIPRYRADRWDVPKKHPVDSRWAIAVDERLAAFKTVELGTTTTKDSENKDVTTNTKVVEWTGDWTSATATTEPK